MYLSWAARFGGAAASDLSDSEIKAQAEAYAREACTLDIGELTAGGSWQEFARLVEFCRVREVEPPPVRLLLSGMGARVRCQFWWRRALRKLVARKCELGALTLGLVSRPSGQPYASNRAVLRRIDQNRRNAETAESVYFENDEGLVLTLAELAAKSTANNAIRRGELMTRIKGCEAIADECGHPGLFLTLTCPSRFHSTLRDGRRNPKYDGSDPRQAQDWLRKMWARARAKFARRGIGVYGFRVAEPHHDGCPHWHALLWFETAQKMQDAEGVLRSYWLSDAGDEAGAANHRITAKLMISGQATGYVAKYIAKNIDDEGVGAHIDDYADGEIVTQFVDASEVKPSMRVEAWASHWGIRQFQGIGQPAVTVWRELRRVREQQARCAGVGGTVHRAWTAAQRVGDTHASWAGYVEAQGGLMRGRKCRIVLRRELRECDGLYGRITRPVPVGVALNVKCASTVWSERRLWKRIETPDRKEPVSVARSAAPWTRVNNCTLPGNASTETTGTAQGPGTGPTQTNCQVKATKLTLAPGRPKIDNPTRTDAAQLSIKIMTEPKTRALFEDIDDESEEDQVVSVENYAISSFGIDFDVEGLVRRLRKGQIYVPHFQRRFVWNKRESSQFIESLLLGLPVPGIFLAKDRDTERMMIIDGQQRLKSLLFYYEGIFRPEDNDAKPLAFNLEEVQPQFSGKTYNDLEEDEQRRLDNSVIHATIIKQESPKEEEDTSLYYVFGRLNTGGRKLSPQEIRMAIYYGSFAQLIEELNTNKHWRDLYGKASERLKDQELILRFLALHFGPKYARPMEEFLNQFAKRHQKAEAAFLDNCRAAFEATMATAHKELGAKAFRPSRALNAASFDSVAIGLARRLEKGPINDSEQLRAAHAALQSNTEYSAATSRATSDEANVASRIRIATDAFGSVD